jgi:hypothetical protein
VAFGFLLSPLFVVFMVWFVRDLSSDIDRRGARAVSILLGAFPIIVLYRLPAGGRHVGGVDDEALVDRQQVFPLQDPTAD